jgi:hypothetical protein
MRTVIRLVLGIMIGVFVSLVTLAMAQIGVNLLTGLETLGRTITVIALLSGAMLGAVSVGLSYLTAGIERILVVMLIGLAVAAVAVIVGQYGNSSILPLGIYGLTVINGLTIARVTSLLSRPVTQTQGTHLQG